MLNLRGAALFLFCFCDDDDVCLCLSIECSTEKSRWSISNSWIMYNCSRSYDLCWFLIFYSFSSRSAKSKFIWRSNIHWYLHILLIDKLFLNNSFRAIHELFYLLFYWEFRINEKLDWLEIASDAIFFSFYDICVTWWPLNDPWQH